ncbi:MAG: RluA family pseudouridine synthase [Lachnospiraceae bacterium]|nr:RluA family pseudouridine synthase [Lachnospiraceae bacterium]
MSVFIATEEDEGDRIDKVITRYFDGLSRSYLQKLIKEERVFVNNSVVKASFTVSERDMISCELPPCTEPEILAEDIPLDIIYEDDDLLIVNKPKGMVVHPSPGHYTGTLVNALMYHCKGQLSGINGVYRPGIVHRIDKDTTGSLIVCKNEASHNAIAAQLKEHSINRKYRAIVCGAFPDKEGTIDAPIGRDVKDRKKMAVNRTNGKNAITHYTVLATFDKYSYVECRLETGRTHQIRVHMTSIGHPLLGDTIYGNRPHPYKLQGQTLHAMTIGFIHPTSGEYMEFEAPLPAYFSHLLDVLGN